MKKLLIILVITLALLFTPAIAKTGKIQYQVPLYEYSFDVNKNGTVIIDIPRNSIIEILGTKGNIVKLKYKNYIGYTKKEYIHFIRELDI